MPKQKSIFKVLGTMGDATFIKTKDGYQVKQKSEVSDSKFASDPHYARTRENAAEFGRAGRAGKLLRTSIRTLLQNGKDSRVTSRLTKEMMRILKTDMESIRGERSVANGEIELLEGFEFNINAVLNTTFSVNYTPVIDRATGKLDINLPAFVPSTHILAPEGSTHCKLVSAAAEIDFANDTFVASESGSAALPLNGTTVAAFTLSHTLTNISTHPLFLFLGIQFTQQVNGRDYILKNESFNALSLIKVES